MIGTRSACRAPMSNDERDTLIGGACRGGGSTGAGHVRRARTGCRLGRRRSADRPEGAPSTARCWPGSSSPAAGSCRCSRLVDDLWEQDPPAGAVSAIRTFVAALRRALEPGANHASPRNCWSPRGRATRCEPSHGPSTRGGSSDAVALASAESPPRALDRLDEALSWWRGPAYADFDGRAMGPRRAHPPRTAAADRDRTAGGDATGTRPGRRRDAGPRRARGRASVAGGGVAAAGDSRSTAPAGRATRSRCCAEPATCSGEQLGVDPGPAPAPTGDRHPAADRTGRHRYPDAASRAWAEATAAYDHAVAPGARARLESTVGLLRSLAMTGAGRAPSSTRTAARRHRGSRAAGRSRADRPRDRWLRRARDLDPLRRPRAGGTDRGRGRAGARRVCSPVRSTPPGPVCSRRSRWSRAARARRAAPRPPPKPSGSPVVWATRRCSRSSLNGVFMQSFGRAGLAPQRDLIGAELVSLSARHGLVTFEILGHLVRLQARCALADFAAADAHAAAADRLAERTNARWSACSPSGTRLRDWPRPGAVTESRSRLPTSGGEARRRRNARRRTRPAATGPLCLRVSHHQPPTFGADTDWGPYEPWARPLLLLASDRNDDAAEALRGTPYPPHDLLFEALWCLTAQAAIALGDRDTMRRAHDALVPAAGEIAGAGSGMLTVGPVSRHLDELADALRSSS